jgi:DNA-binding HxlR family transcriptional regulator
MYPEVPPRVEYALTPHAITLRSIVGQLVEGSRAHLPADGEPVIEHVEDAWRIG